VLSPSWGGGFISFLDKDKFATRSGKKEGKKKEETEADPELEKQEKSQNAEPPAVGEGNLGNLGLPNRAEGSDQNGEGAGEGRKEGGQADNSEKKKGPASTPKRLPLLKS